MKREITDSQLLELRQAAHSSTPGDEEKTLVAQADLSHLDAPESSFWDLSRKNAPVLGIHMRESWSGVVLLSSDHQVLTYEEISEGYSHATEAIEQIKNFIEKSKLSGIQIALVLTGDQELCMLSKSPPLSQVQRQKVVLTSLKHELKSQNIVAQSILLAPSEGEEKIENYMMGGLTLAIRDKVSDAFRRKGLRISFWDMSLLAYLKGGRALWSQFPEAIASTQCFVILEWKSCSLVVAGAEGALSVFKMQIGTYHFLEHLANRMEEATISTHWLSPQSLEIKETDKIDVQEKKLRAKEAIHSLFVPLAQQIKSHLYQICSDIGVEMPTHFAMLGEGAQYFNLQSLLEQDMQMQAIEAHSWLSPKLIAAAGAGLTKNHSLHANFMPSGPGESWRLLVDRVDLVLKQAKQKMRSQFSGVDIEVGEGGKTRWILGSLVFLALLAIPVTQRHFAQKKLSVVTAKLTKLTAEKSSMGGFVEQQKIIEKKFFIKKKIKESHLPLDLLVSELLSTMPRELKLVSLHLDKNGVQLSGVSSERQAIEEYIRQSPQLKHLGEVIPISIRSENNVEKFKLRYDYRK